MSLVAYFQQEMPVFQHRVSTLQCLTETQSRHSHETQDMTRHGNLKHELRRDIQVSRLSQDRDMEAICLETVSRQTRVRIESESEQQKPRCVNLVLVLGSMYSIRCVSQPQPVSAESVETQPVEYSVSDEACSFVRPV